MNPLMRTISRTATLLLTVTALLGCNTMAVQGSNKPYPIIHSLASTQTIDIGGSGELRIENGSANQLIVLAKGAVHDRLVITQVNGTLSIQPETGMRFRNREPIQYLVITDGLETIKLSGALGLTAADYQTERLNINSSGASNLDVQIRTEQLTIKASGALEGLLSGTAERLLLTLTGTAQVQALDLLAKDVQVNLAGASSVEVTAADSLQIDISGASEVGYQGRPRISSSVSAASRVYSVE